MGNDLIRFSGIDDAKTKTVIHPVAAESAREKNQLKVLTLSSIFKHGDAAVTRMIATCYVTPLNPGEM